MIRLEAIRDPGLRQWVEDYVRKRYEEIKEHQFPKQQRIAFEEAVADWGEATWARWRQLQSLKRLRGAWFRHDYWNHLWVQRIEDRLQAEVDDAHRRRLKEEILEKRMERLRSLKPKVKRHGATYDPPFGLELEIEALVELLTGIPPKTYPELPGDPEPRVDVTEIP